MKITYTRQVISSFSIETAPDGLSHFVSDDFPNLKIYPTSRFWRSLWNELKVNENLFDYFSSEEIFAQVVKRDGGQAYRFCLENHGAFLRLLGLSSLAARREGDHGPFSTNSFVTIEKVIADVKAEDTVESGYDDGQIFSVGRLDGDQLFISARTRFERTRARLKGEKTQDSGMDKRVLGVLNERGITPCFLRRQPVDGLGFGSFCYGITIGDGFIFFDSARTKASSVLGESVVEEFAMPNESRSGRKGEAKESVNESVYEAVSKRLAHAKESAASLQEIAAFYRVLDTNGLSIARFDVMLGRPFEGYGLASYNALSKTRLSRLPTRNSILDLLETMALAAAGLTPGGRFKLYRLAGSMIAEYFDFESLSFDDIIVAEKTRSIDRGSPELIGGKVEVDLSSLKPVDKAKKGLTLVSTRSAEESRKIA